MPRQTVHILPEAVSNMIAAGEVVDRPASVVKELVENSIDAGARNVVVAVAGAGKELISVEDDGLGMSEEDALLSLKRHATSKISSASDLDGIVTLGFRGEALPSIASVSRLTLVTRMDDSLEAVKIVVEGGREPQTEACAGARGTRVEVRELFFNTPARRKFLKSDATEVRNISEAVAKLALIHPSVGFEVESEGRRLLSVPPGQTLRQRAGEAAFGQASLYWYTREEEGMALTIAFASPHEGKGRRDSMRFFVNRRGVSDRILLGAAMEGYRGLLGEGRYPVLFLWLALNPTEVDVNVHPAKREVRFAEEGRIFRFVSSSISRALSEAPWLYSDPGEASQGGAEAGAISRVAEAISHYGRPPAGANHRAGSAEHYRPSEGWRRHPSGATGWRNVPLAGVAEMRSPEDGPFAGLRYLGVVGATYLVYEDAASGGLAVIDQHAAHERILYEKFLIAARDRTSTQKMLVPVVVECGAAKLGLLTERLKGLEALGFSAEPFGGRSVSVTSAPPGLGAEAISAVVEDFLSAETEEEVEGLRPLEERLAARAACAAAVKAGMALHETEAKALLDRLGKLENPTHCPHGRPLILRLGAEKLESLFHRR